MTSSRYSSKQKPMNHSGVNSSRPNTLNFSHKNPKWNESDSDDHSSEGINDYSRYWNSRNISKYHYNKTNRRHNCHSNTASSTLSSSSFSSSNYDTSSADSNRFRILTYEQVHRLHDILNSEMSVHSRLPEMPTIRVKLQTLFTSIKHALSQEGIILKDIKFNGGLASHVISTNRETPFNDIDVLLSVDLSSSASTICRIKTIVMSVLMSFMPENPEVKTSSNYSKSDIKAKSSTVSPVVSPDCDQTHEDTNNLIYKHLNGNTNSIFIQDYNLQESYIFKQFRMFSQETDCWSLLALGCPTPNSKVIELKFVDRMKRQYEFTVDSFQIQLDSLLNFYSSHDKIDPNFYPTVVAESVSGSFQDALYHLEEKYIVTYNPESVRGGGLLKYCKLIVEGYKPGEDINITLLERYMCSRFFIDFTELNSQRCKLESYLSNHFQPHDEETMIRYLTTLFHVVNGSTVCLMSQDHYNILETVVQLIHHLINRIQTRNKAIRLDAFSNSDSNSGEFELDRIYYGDHYFPVVQENETKVNNKETTDQTMQ